MSSASPFSIYATEEVENLTKSGSVSSSFNDSGVLLLDYQENSVSSSLVVFPLVSTIFSPEQISKRFGTDFTEFVDVVPVVQATEVTASVEVTQSVEVITSSADNAAALSDSIQTKDVILELRKNLGQGASESDFDNTFPYLPLNNN
jgi:hypothetical protein